MSTSPKTTTKPARVPRLYVAVPLDNKSVVLDGKQAHYLRHVLRLKPGHSVTVFDGRGSELSAQIDTLTRDRATLRITGTSARIPESPLSLTLLQGIAKADAMDLIVQKVTELGVQTIAPVVTEFSVVKLDAQRVERRLEHWRRIARSACEQCERHSPPVILAPEPLAASLERLVPAGTRLALDPAASQDLSGSPGLAHDAARLVMLIGPEGGLSERDLWLADRAQFKRVKLGPRILRTETAAIAACSLAQAYWGDAPGIYTSA